jgi:hypothetical protein
LNKFSKKKYLFLYWREFFWERNVKNI